MGILKSAPPRLRKALVQLGVLREHLFGGLLVLTVYTFELTVNAYLCDLFQRRSELIGEVLQAVGNLVGELNRECFHDFRNVGGWSFPQRSAK